MPREHMLGRPPYDPVLMFKMLVLQALYSLSDEGLEFQVKDRLSFQRFLGLGLDGRVPDATTLWLFRERLVNPHENVWQFMRDNWLSNRVFASYDDIVDHCCDAWNKLVEQPWRIMSLGLRRWAQEF